MRLPRTEREEDIQARAIVALTTLGYRVLQTTHRYRRTQCPHCGAMVRAAGGYGSTEGVPDLLVTHNGWPAATWLGIEMKGPTTRLSAVQRLLLSASRIFIARSVVMAVGQVQTWEMQQFGRLYGRKAVWK